MYITFLFEKLLDNLYKIIPRLVKKHELSVRVFIYLTIFSINTFFRIFVIRLHCVKFHVQQEKRCPVHFKIKHSLFMSFVF